MTSLPEFLNDAKCARSLVGCLPLKDVFRLRSLCRDVGSESIVKAFETDRAESVANAKVAVELGLGEPVRHRGVGPNEIEISVKFVDGVAVVPHDIMLYVPPKSPQGNAAAAVELGINLRAAAAAHKRKRNPAGRNAELTEDDFVRRVAGLVAPGARMTIPALEGAYEGAYETSMIQDAAVLKKNKAARIKKLVTAIANYGVSAGFVKSNDGSLSARLPSGWSRWGFPRQKTTLRFFREM